MSKRRHENLRAGALRVKEAVNEALKTALGVAGFRVLDADQAAYYELGQIAAEDLARRKRKREVMERIGL
jgi:hypothetical protein